MSTVTKEERHILEHTVGFRSRSPFYRNHFCTGPDCDNWATIQKLVERGLMYVRLSADPIFGGMTTFAVTDAGKELLNETARMGR